MSSLEINNNHFDRPLVGEDIDAFTPLDQHILSTQFVLGLCENSQTIQRLSHLLLKLLPKCWSNFGPQFKSLSIIIPFKIIKINMCGFKLYMVKRLSN